MAHKDRISYIPQLVKQLGKVNIFVDDGTLGAPGNAIQCWENFDKRADYHLVIQDDAILTEDFLNKAKYYLRGQPIINFYCGKKWSEDLNMTEEKDYRISEQNRGAVAVAIKTKYIPEMINEMKKMSHIDGDDRRIKRFFRNKGIKTYFTKPSLVNHRVGIKSIWQTYRQGKEKVVGKGRTAVDFK